MKKSQALKEIIRTNWGKYKSTSKMSEELGIPMRTIQHYILKLQREEGITLPGYVYRQLLTEKEEPVVLATEKDLTHLQRSTDTEIFDDGQEDFEEALESARVDKINTYQNTFLKTNFLNVDNGYVVVFSDAHYYPGNPSPVAHTALLKVIKQLDPEVVVANGDIFDFNSISKHGKNGYSRVFSLKEELDHGLAKLQEIEEASNGAKLLYTVGNHCVIRWDSYLAEKAGQYAGLKGFKFQDQIEKWKLSLEILINKDSTIPTLIKHRTNQGGIHVSYNNAQKTMLSIVTGHTHRLGVRALSNGLGRYYYGVETGCLTDLDNNAFFDYTEGRSNQKDWLAGFVVLQFKDGKLLHPEICYVQDGVAYFRGQKVE